MEELIPITMFVCIAAVAILRPISKRLGGLLEVMTRERTASNVDSAELTRVRTAIEHVARRIDLMEERLDFTERLLSAGRPPAAQPLYEPVREPGIERLAR